MWIQSRIPKNPPRCGCRASYTFLLTVCPGGSIILTYSPIYLLCAQVRLVGDFDEWTRGVELSASEIDIDSSLRSFEALVPLLPVSGGVSVAEDAVAASVCRGVMAGGRISASNCLWYGSLARTVMPLHGHD